MFSWWKSTESSSNVYQKERKSVEVKIELCILAVAFHPDGKHIVTGNRYIQRWRVEDGMQVGTSVDSGSANIDIAVSQDGKWVVSGTLRGGVLVWNAGSLEKVIEFQAHTGEFCQALVDISPDAIRIVTGSEDKTACVWSLSTGQRLLGPWKHNCFVAAVKFSPDGRLIATATAGEDSVRVYDNHNGHLLFDAPIFVASWTNQGLAWPSNSTHLLVLSRDYNVHCLDVSNGTTVSRWRVHTSGGPDCISLASDGTFVAVSNITSVSFWDTKTHKQIGPVIKPDIKYPWDMVFSMAISENYDIVIVWCNRAVLRSLCDILPSPYCDNILRERVIRLKKENADLEETIRSVRVQEENSSRVNARLEETICQLRTQLFNSLRITDERERSLHETIMSLRADLHANSKITYLEQTVEELRAKLVDSQHPADQDKGSFNQPSTSLRAEFHTQDASSNKKIARVEKAVQEHRVHLTTSQNASNQNDYNPKETPKTLRVNDRTPNESSKFRAVIPAMQYAGGFSAQEFHSGLIKMREKLSLASTVQMMPVEDIAHSFFGISNATIHGEGDRAVGCLLEHILAGSGDITILDWTGQAGNYNSCLPLSLTVYSRLMPTHIPQPMEKVEMDGMVTRLRSCLLDPTRVRKLYDCLNELPSPSLTAGCLCLPGIVLRLPKLTHTSGPDPVTNLHAYHATKPAFGKIEIKTADDLAGKTELYLVHPWIRPLLDQEFSEGATTLDSTTQALRLYARLRQPFGALLFEKVSRTEHRRVAADGLIMVQIREEVPLPSLLDNIRTIEVR